MSGRLSAQSSDEVRKSLGDLESVRVAEVSELGLVDESGLAFLAELRGAGAALEGLSPYLSLRLGLLEKSAERKPEDGSSE